MRVRIQSSSFSQSSGPTKQTRAIYSKPYKEVRQIRLAAVGEQEVDLVGSGDLEGQM